VVHVFDLETDQVTSNEDAVQDLKLVSLEELIAGKENLESWSKICVEHLASV
jgi:predicted NUDIX family phosphoesterase